VADGLILCISTIVHSRFFVKKLWLPSPIKLISSEIGSQKECIRSVVFENVSNLERIEGTAFRHANLKFVRIPVCVSFLGEECFSQCKSLSSVRFESGSRLSRITNGAFYGTGLVEIILPASVIEKVNIKYRIAQIKHTESGESAKSRNFHVPIKLALITSKGYLCQETIGGASIFNKNSMVRGKTNHSCV
jgi:hypothetical protein